MTTLTIYAGDGREGETTTDQAVIAATLGSLGVHYERWQANRRLASDAGQDEVLEAYRDEIERLNADHGFQSVDVVSLGPDHPDRATLRRKFLAEHTHEDFEIRFFVAGRGLFYLHVDGRVYLVLCEQGDLISVPANTTHWFDMGEKPCFTCIRFFTTPEGWLGHFTGSDIASRFPDFDTFVAAAPA
jgi:1,2-dihydroxy-3-keto-5-methylthiopentene dioxygenase